MSKPKASLLIASALAALGITTGTYVARQIVMVSPPPIMPANPVEGGGGNDLIPEERLVDWTPGTYVGVTGGIPTGRTQCVTTECVALTGAASGYKDLTLDAQALIQAAVTSATANTYVLVPDGDWRLDSAVVIGPNDDSITLRGSGDTHFECRNASRCFFVGSESDYLWNWPASGNSVTAYGSGGTVLTIADTSEFSAGQLIRWVVENDLTVPVMSVSGYGYANTDAQYLRKQMTRVVSKTGSTLTVFPAIYGYARFTGLTARVNSATFQSDYVGLEDFSVDATTQTNNFNNILFVQTTNSWMKNITSIGSLNYTVYLLESLQCEVRKSTMGELVGSGTNGAALLMNTVSGCLIEDNIVTDAFPNVEVNHGSSGNVFAYNFFHAQNGGITVDTNHGPHNAFNLYEGNITTNILSDGYFGGESEITLYRNWVHGNGVNCADSIYCSGGRGTEMDDASYMVSLKRFTRNASIVGNVLGAEVASTTGLDYGTPNLNNPSFISTAQPSLSDWWYHFDGTNTVISGQLTTRTDANNGVITLNAAHLSETNCAAGGCQYPIIRSNDGATYYGYATVTSGIATTTVTITTGWTLPALNTLFKIWARSEGFQEKDLDVEATVVAKANYEDYVNAVVGDLAGATLVDSLFRDSKPSWFNGLTWPPVNPNSPTYDYEIIPAGYRYMNAGSDPP